ncbi:MAG: YrhK family protein [Ferroplasma sp.]
MADGIQESLYFLYAIKKSPYCFNLKWKDIKPVTASLFGPGIFEELRQNRVISTYGDENGIEIINVKNIHHDISDDEKEDIFKKFITFFSNNKLVTGLMEIMYLDRKLAQFLMDSLEQNNNEEIEAGRASFPIINYVDFYYSNAFSNYFMDRIEKNDLNMEKFKGFLGKDWFVELIIILRDGSYNNNSMHQSIENNSNEFVMGIKNLLENDMLAVMIEHLNSFLNDSDVNHALSRYSYKAMREKRIKRFYYWLAIANDIMVGLEFVIGSIFFLPSESKYSTLGVYLFILGSSQLLIRPMIQIAKTIHIWLLHKNR